MYKTSETGKMVTARPALSKRKIIILVAGILFAIFAIAYVVLTQRTTSDVDPGKVIVENNFKDAVAESIVAAEEYPIGSFERVNLLANAAVVALSRNQCESAKSAIAKIVTNSESSPEALEAEKYIKNELATKCP